MGRPNVGDEEDFTRRVGEMLRRRWFTNDGPSVVELERLLAERLEVEECVVVCSGTTALRLMVRAADLSGEVLVPSFTFVATAHALAWEGLTPVFCDIDPVTWNLDSQACEDVVTPETKAVVGVHLFGRPCDVESLRAFAARHGLQVFYDAAHAFGCTHGGRPIGGFGRAEAFSFHSTKAFHTFEGGCVATNDVELANRVRLLRNFGFRGIDDVAGLGVNGKMPEVCAAMGLSNLACFDSLVEVNRQAFAAYRRGMAGTPGLRLRSYDDGQEQNWHYVVVEVDESSFGLRRDQVVQVLNAENVLARRYFYPGVHAMEPYRSRDPDAGSRLPATVAAGSRVLVLPSGQSLRTEAIDEVCSILRRASSQSGEIQRLLGR